MWIRQCDGRCAPAAYLAPVFTIRRTLPARTPHQPALVSFQLGRANVDRTLKETPEDAGEGWAELAQQLLYEMLMRLDNSYNPAPERASSGQVKTAASDILASVSPIRGG